MPKIPKPKHKETVVTEIPELSPYFMDLKAIEKSLEYIKDHKGKGEIPQEPVIFIFTTLYYPSANILKSFSEKIIAYPLTTSYHSGKSFNMQYHFPHLFPLLTQINICLSS